jgi:polyhydroxyalkanoate synthesis regulator protein
MQMFTPFPTGGSGSADNGKDEPPPEADEAGDELSELKNQIKAMQRKLDSLDRNGG